MARKYVNCIWVLLDLNNNHFLLPGLRDVHDINALLQMPLSRVGKIPSLKKSKFCPHALLLVHHKEYMKQGAQPRERDLDVTCTSHNRMPSTNLIMQ